MSVLLKQLPVDRNSIMRSNQMCSNVSVCSVFCHEAPPAEEETRQNHQTKLLRMTCRRDAAALRTEAGTKEALGGQKL